MIVELSKKDLINLCYGLTPPWGVNEYTEYCGDQWNEEWCWKYGIFENMNENELWKFYQQNKNK
jgi:hypothetical protein